MTEIIIVGAGPIGLILAALLGEKGFSVVVFEKRINRLNSSNAIGITPPSLALLAKLGVDRALVEAGAPIQDVYVHGENRQILGQVDFRGVSESHPFILAVPQSVTEKTLEERVRLQANVRLEFGWEFHELRQTSDAVCAVFRNETGETHTESASYLVACDGAKSDVRARLALERKEKKYTSTFFMADFEDDSGWADEAHLFFTRRGAVESFPLGSGRRRWIVQTPDYLEEPGEYLESEVKARTGIVLDPRLKLWQSPFGIHRWISPRYEHGRVYLCGDSAHQMSPIGGQGMNTGFADAEFLAALLDYRAHGGTDLEREYTKARRKACAIAARRAEFSMFVGTIRGRASALRNLFLKFLLNGVFRKRLPPFYAMMNIPNRNLADTLRRAQKRLKPLQEYV